MRGVSMRTTETVAISLALVTTGCFANRQASDPPAQNEKLPPAVEQLVDPTNHALAGNSVQLAYRTDQYRSQCAAEYVS